MRNPDRIPQFCNYLATVWKTYFPDWRFGQLLDNILNWANVSPFYLEEEDWIKLINEFTETFTVKEGAV